MDRLWHGAPPSRSSACAPAIDTDVTAVNNVKGLTPLPELALMSVVVSAWLTQRCSGQVASWRAVPGA